MICSKIHIPSRIDKRNAEKEGQGTKIYENQHKKEDESNRKDWIRLRAENETRTRDPNLGKVVLYQLSYFRKCEEEETRTPTSQLTLPPQSSASTNSATSPLHIRSTCFIISEGVFRCGLSLWHRACFPFAIAKVRHLSQLAKLTRKKNAISAVFLPFRLQERGYSCRNTGIFLPKHGDFSPKGGGFFRRSPTFLPSPACGGPKARGDDMFARLLLCLRALCAPCASRAIAVDWVQRQKNRPSPTFSCGEVGDGLWWVASTTAQF